MESDRPIQKSSEDRFGRWHFAQRAAQVIAGRDDSSSIVVGIHAPWGEGKTSVLNMIVEELEKHENVLVIHFNPWRFPDEAQLLHSFFTTLSSTVDATLETRGEKFGAVAKKYAGLLAPVSLLGFNASEVAKGASNLLPSATLEQLKERMADALTESGKRVVVIMDDIDRLDKEEVQAVFKLVKLSADFPHTAYILSFDEERVAAALAEKYGGVEAGRNFLEKIVQVSLPLPSASTEALRTLTFEGVDAALKLAEIELSEQQAQKFVNTFFLAFESRLATPRLAKRYTNSLTFSLPILKGEVNPVDLMLISAVRTFYPRLYWAIRNNPDLFLGTNLERGGGQVREVTKAVIEDALSDLSEKDKKAARKVIQELFPRTGALGVLGTVNYGSEWYSVWGKEKRITTPSYFNRYFSFGVPPHDISERQLDEFLDAVAEGDMSKATEKIRQLVSNNRAALLIEKLRAKEDSIQPAAAANLAMTIALSGDEFPIDKGMFGMLGTSTFSQACILIRHLVKRIEDDEKRESLAIELAERATPLPFAVEYVRWVRNLSSSEEERNSVISDESELEIDRRIVARIAAEAEEEALEKRYPKGVSHIYQYWRYHDAESLNSHLERRFKARPIDVLAFLSSQTREGWNLDSGISFRMNLERNDYNAIASMVNPEIIMSALHSLYPGIETQSLSADEDGEITDDKVALAFIRLHQHVQREAQEQGSGSSGQTDASEGQGGPHTEEANDA